MGPYSGNYPNPDTGANVWDAYYSGTTARTKTGLDMKLGIGFSCDLYEGLSLGGGFECQRIGEQATIDTRADESDSVGVPKSRSADRYSWALEVQYGFK